MRVLSTLEQRQRFLSIAAAIAGLGLWGCSTSATLPRGPLTFVPNGAHALVWSEGRLGLYDLGTGKGSWRVPVLESQQVVVSSSGAHFALADRPAPGGALRLSVYRTSDGVAVAPPIEPAAAATAPQVPVAVSDDGLTLVAVDTERSYVYDVPKRTLLGEMPGFLRNGAFKAGTAQLAVGSTERLVIAERRTNQLVELARIPGRGYFSWFPGGLCVISKTGVDVWDGHALVHALQIPIKFDATRSDESSYVAFSADGRFFANETEKGLVVYDLRAGRALFTRSDLKGIFGVAFRGDRMRVIWDDNSSDDATMSWASELELPSGRTLTSKKLGKRVGWIKKGVLEPHAGPDGHFIPKLSPTGNFVDLERLYSGEHDIRAL